MPLSMEDQLLQCGFVLCTTKMLNTESNKYDVCVEAYKKVDPSNTVITERNDMGNLIGCTIWVYYSFREKECSCGINYTESLQRTLCNNITGASIEKSSQYLKILYKYLFEIGLFNKKQYDKLCKFEVTVPIDFTDLSKKGCYELENMPADA